MIDNIIMTDSRKLDKNCLVRVRTTQIVVQALQAKHPSLHTMKWRTFTLQRLFFFFNITNT